MDIKLSKNDKRNVESTDDVFGIMQRVLLRDNKIDQEKEHFWIVGMNEAGFILYIELIALGSFNKVHVEPMNVFRVAVMKNASRVIAVHNHPTGRLIPSVGDKEITDQLIQVGKILNIKLVDHMIISTTDYESFVTLGLMDELVKSLKYVPTYQVIEQIRKEEKKIARQAVKAANDKTKAAKEETKDAKEKARIEKEQRQIEQKRREKLELAMVTALLEKNVSIADIAKIMDISTESVETILGEKS